MDVHRVGMRNDQLGVLLRDFAKRCLEWAAVLEKVEPGDPAVDLAFLERNPFTSPVPSPVPTAVAGTPSPTDGGTLPDDVRHRLALHTLDGNLYEALLTYLVQFQPSKVYRSRDGRLMISKYAVLTDAEITEALR